MSNQSLEDKLGDVVVSVRELTTEIRHLIKAHDETKTQVTNIDARLSEVEKKQAGETVLLGVIAESRKANRGVAYAIIGSILTIAIVGGLAFKFSGGS